MIQSRMHKLSFHIVTIEPQQLTAKTINFLILHIFLFPYRLKKSSGADIIADFNECTRKAGAINQVCFT
jgi:hypothetical protein